MGAISQRADASATQHRRRRRHTVAEGPRSAAVITAAAATAAVNGVGERRLRAGQLLLVGRSAVVAVPDVTWTRIGAIAMTHAYNGTAVRLEPRRVVIARVGGWRRRYRVELLR